MMEVYKSLYQRNSEIITYYKGNLLIGATKDVANDWCRSPPKW